VPAWWTRVPVRIHGEHGWEAKDVAGGSLRYRNVRRLYMPFVHHYVALSADLASYLENKVGVPRRRIARICNGVDVAQFAPPAPGAARPPGLPFGAGYWLVGTVGRLDAVKDHCNLARAFALAVAAHPAAARRMRLVIVGEGPTLAAVRAILREAGIEQLAWFAGERDDVPRLLQHLDCFVLPSQAEGISNTLLEAMACGRCIVATRVGGNPELVEDGVSGTLVAPRDPGALSVAVLRCFADPWLIRAHGAAARERAVEQFSLEHMVARYQALYLTLLARHRRRVGAGLAVSARPH
jgi:sugar transferase (PEP-CTERM/EpsH1 system associated)